MVVKRTPTPITKLPTTPTQTLQIFKNTEDLDLSSQPVRPVVKPTIPERTVTLEQTQRTDRLSGTDDRKDKTKFHREMLKATQIGMFKLEPKF